MSAEKPVVVLLHGALRTRISMLLVERGLKKAGFDTLNRSYSWRSRTLEQLADDLAQKLGPFDGREIHFVTHSFGALVARAYLVRHKPENVRRMVNLAPPHRGAMLAEKSAKDPFFRKIFQAIYGHAGPELRRMKLRRLPRPSCEFAVIAGGRGKKTGYSPFLPGDNDGALLVSETKLAGMKAFVVVPHSHTFIMNGRDTIALTIRFLKEGRF